MTKDKAIFFKTLDEAESNQKRYAGSRITPILNYRSEDVQATFAPYNPPKYVKGKFGDREQFKFTGLKIRGQKFIEGYLLQMVENFQVKSREERNGIKKHVEYRFTKTQVNNGESYRY
jgi:hypothetical protein